jgi:hypothetical protein
VSDLGRNVLPTMFSDMDYHDDFALLRCHLAFESFLAALLRCPDLPRKPGS